MVYRTFHQISLLRGRGAAGKGGGRRFLVAPTSMIVGLGGRGGGGRLRLCKLPGNPKPEVSRSPSPPEAPSPEKQQT